VTDQESSLSYPGWKVVLAGFFGVMVSFAAIVPYTFGLFLKPLSLSFGWGRESISIAFSIAALAVAACSPAIGHLLDRYGPRRIILPCIVIFSAALGSLALLTNHIAHFYIVFLLLGIVGNGTAYLGYSRAIASWFVRRRGMAFAVMLAGGGCGAMLLPIFAQSLISNYGWRIAYAGIGLVAFAVGFPLTALFVREQPASEHPERSSLYAGESVRNAMRSRIFWIETGRRAHLGAYHGEELIFLSDSFPSGWEHSNDDKVLGKIMRGYWTQFARTGNPNTPGLPGWPPYDAHSDQCLELGRTIRVHPVASLLQVIEHIMKQVSATTTTGVPPPPHLPIGRISTDSQ